MTQKIFGIISISLFFILVLSCSAPVNRTNPSKQCLPPLVLGSIGNYEGNSHGIPVEPQMAPAGWKEVINLPMDESGNRSWELLMAENELLLLRGAHAEQMIYHTGLDVLYSLPKESSEVVFILDYQGNVWGYESRVIGQTINMFKYDPQTQEIFPKSVTISIPLREIRKMIPSPSGGFWVLATSSHESSYVGKVEPAYETEKVSSFYNIFETEIVSDQNEENVKFNSTITEFIRKELRQTVMRAAIFDGYVVDSKDRLYLIFKDGGFGKDVTFRIDPDGKREIIALTNSDLNTIDYRWEWQGLLIDNSNNLWIGDYAIVNLDETSAAFLSKKIIIRSPVFITNRVNDRAEVVWSRPSPNNVTEDGRIWYSSLRGDAWHQPETGEWCMFTTANSNIVQDGEGNLWIIYDNALYMLPAKETRAKN